MQKPRDGRREPRSRSQETAGKDRGGLAGYTEASLPRKNGMPGRAGRRGLRLVATEGREGEHMYTQETKRLQN